MQGSLKHSRGTHTYRAPYNTVVVPIHTGLPIDLEFGTALQNRKERLSVPKYSHKEAMLQWTKQTSLEETNKQWTKQTSLEEAKKQWTKKTSAHTMSDLLIEPTEIGRGTPNRNLPWHVPPCTDFPERPNLKPSALRPNQKSTHSLYIIKALNELGVYYRLDAGSLLGSYRHGGFIPADKDLDIVLPVRRNLHLVGADHYCQGIFECRL
ncbi:hypothetical protein SARC_00145 [Sphaeroforma arctica JP610]|uniref:LicD/FKTN/FKRP nucleotidyltransferase domain-containing protein n=1 Tax=Sphaeroforma arctica JP610 TaxID=667725 RepID=A0A0L0GHF4_9EUKA|nr:hypothetical protein SARC_00145 [Sphaeroforma arctica JP610]KNC87773.1 hypothetical protein SARC_00145 [Sphaeroforma arctica JP610]|eukprot:XP_014161675.1 hypothetical protein SARC_00145 [Sphaeroforma arctica JP610]